MNIKLNLVTTIAVSKTKLCFLDITLFHIWIHEKQKKKTTIEFWKMFFVIPFTNLWKCRRIPLKSSETILLFSTLIFSSVWMEPPSFSSITPRTNELDFPCFTFGKFISRKFFSVGFTFPVVFFFWSMFSYFNKYFFFEQKWRKTIFVDKFFFLFKKNLLQHL